MLKKARPESVRVSFADNAPTGVALELPSRRSWAAGLILGTLFVIFAAVLCFQIANVHTKASRSVFDLSFLLFEIFWIVGWSVGVIILGLLTVLFLAHSESARLAAGRLIYVPRLGPLKFIIEYDLAKMRNLRVESAGNTETVRIRFDYGEGVAGLGDSMPREDAERLIAQIRASTSGMIAPSADMVSSPMSAATDVSPAPAKDLPVPKPLALTSPSALALMAANAIPLLGVIAGGWSLADVMVLYWSESAIIGLFTLVKIAIVGKWAVLFAGPFFVGHFGGFMAAHFLFVYTLFVTGFTAESNEPALADALTGLFVPLWPALAALTLSHAVSFAFNFLGQREYAGASLNALMMEPYKRVIVMHLTIIFGGGLALALGTPAPALALLIVLKIAVDLRAHTRQHRAAAEQS